MFPCHSLRVKACQAALCVFALIVCIDSAFAKDWRELRIASEGARPPYNYLDPNGELMGFEIDLGQELCARMKVTCTFIPHDWESLMPALIDGRVDAIMAALEITDEKLQTIDFSKPYVRIPNAFVVARDGEWKSTQPGTFIGKSIGVESDGAHQNFLESRYPGAEVKTYGSLEEAILDVAEGRVDSVFGDLDAIADFLKNRREAKCCKLLGYIPRDPTFFGEGMGVGLRQEDQDLKELFNAALEALIADGTFARIRAKHFEFEVR